MLLSIAVLIAFFLLFFFFSLRKIGGGLLSYYASLFSALSDGAKFQGGKRTLFLFSALFVHLGGIVIPALTLLYFRFSTWLWLLSVASRRKKWKESTSKTRSLEEIEALCRDTLRRGDLEYSVRFLLARDTGRFDASPGCQIVKKGQEIFLIIYDSLLESFESGKLNKGEIQAIFSHEISHIYHGDYLFPLWGKYLIYSYW
ncbi:MAG: M48 family metalloprotease [Candidatus Edwardsbacteria bacterium]